MQRQMLGDLMLLSCALLVCCHGEMAQGDESMLKDRKEDIIELEAGKQKLFYHLQAGTARIQSSEGQTKWSDGPLEVTEKELQTSADARQYDLTIPADKLTWAREVGAKVRIEDERGYKIEISSATLPFKELLQKEIHDEFGDGREITIVREDAQGTIRLCQVFRGYEDNDFLFTQCELTNLADEPFMVNALAPLYIAPGQNHVQLGDGSLDWAWYKHGLMHVLGARTFNLVDLCDQLDMPARRKFFPLTSLGHTIFGDTKSNEYALIGVSRHNGQRCEITLTVHSLGHVSSHVELETVCELPGRRLGQGESVQSVEIALRKVAARPHPALVEYAKILGRRMGVKVRHDPPPVVWSSWYTRGLGSTITEEKILAQARAIAKHRNVWPIDVIHMDAGWETEYASYQVDLEKFPRGMKHVADELGKLGFRPGLWNRHFPEVDPESDRRGSYPAVERWMYEVYKREARDWGYEYVKVEYGFHNSPESYAKIREACGEEAIILDCYNPESSIGYCDYMRITNDAHHRWYRPDANRRYLCGTIGMREGCLSSVLRYHENRHLYWIDPDGVSLFETPSDRQGNPYPDSAVDWEMQFYATVTGLAGGAVTCYGDFSKLTPREDSLLSRLVPSFGQAADVMDFFTPGGPQFLKLTVSKPFETWHVVGVLNWSDERAIKELDIDLLELGEGKEYHVWDFWNWRYLGRLSEKMVLPELLGHQCLALSLREVKQGLQLLSTSSHITQGGVELDNVESDPQQIRGRISRPPGTHTAKLVFYVPEGAQLRCHVDEKECPVRYLEPNVAEASLEFETAGDFVAEIDND